MHNIIMYVGSYVMEDVQITGSRGASEASPPACIYTGDETRLLVTSASAIVESRSQTPPLKRERVWSTPSDILGQTMQHIVM